MMIDNTNFYLFFSFLIGILYWNQKENINTFFHDVIQMIQHIKSLNDVETDDDDDSEEKIDKIPESRYEDKYLEKLHQMNPEYVLTEEEKELQQLTVNELKQQLQDEFLNKETEINKLILKMREFENENDEDKEIEMLERNQVELQEQLNNEEGLQEQAEQKVIQKRLEKLKHCFVIEKTPLGNVAMYYNHQRLTFEYYSDNTIPYRFLEVVGRKYVITYQCSPLYVIMEEELKKYEKQMQEKAKQLEEKAKLMEETNSKNDVVIQKKNVFAKFKSYNKEAGSGRVNSAPPPKNSIPNTKNNANKNEKILLKENANRYTYEGRFSNFNPLQKIERKVIDQKYALTFADFKKMQNKGK